jgi:hypothetical protein
MAEVVGAMCGVHAQVMSAAEVSIGIRMAGMTRANVRDALWQARSLVKTRGPRGTVHLLPAGELAEWTGALSAVPVRRGADLLTAAQLDAVVAAIDRVLSEAGAEMTPDEMDAGVVAATGPWAGDRFAVFASGSWPRWRWATAAATNQGVLCFGPNRGNKVTYTSPRRWLPGFSPANGPTGLRWLVRRYLHSYGPASAAHFARWIEGTGAWATKLFASLAEERAIEQVEVEGSDAGWVVAGDTSAPQEPPRGVRLLPYFDAYALASQPRELVFQGPALERALAGGQAGNFPVLLVDGVVAGVWHAKRSGKRMDVTVEPLGTLSAAQHEELVEQAEQVGEISEARATLTIGTVSVGPHA